MLRFGQIVIVEGVLDSPGQNPKDRPCVIVRIPAPTDPLGRYRVVATTTTLPVPLTIDHVPLPWQRPRHPVAGLNERNAGVCSWITSVTEGQIVRKIGSVPAVRLKEIGEALTRLGALTDRGEESP